MNIKIYIRNDLNMRRGKISSQVSHGLMSIWLNASKITNDNLVLSDSNLELYLAWRNNPTFDLIPVNSENEFKGIMESYKAKENTFTTLITDQGRTEFGGKPQDTCFAVIESENYSYYENTDCKPLEGNKELLSKQVIVANKDFKMDKWELAKKVSICSVFGLFNLSEDVDNSIISIPLTGYVKLWINGSFGKVVLKSNTEDINKIRDNLNFDLNCFTLKNESEVALISIGPDKPSEIDKHTSHLKLY